VFQRPATRPGSLLRFSAVLSPVGQYASFPDYLEALKPGEGKRFEANKVAFASRICPLLTKETIAAVLDLDEMLDEACRRIQGWNGR
jgi:hypothetical protein